MALTPEGSLAGAACAEPGVEPALFFPTTDSQATRALELCDTCPVRTACAAEALTIGRGLPAGQGYGLTGVWAGELWQDGRRVDRVPRQGRPPKPTPMAEAG